MLWNERKFAIEEARETNRPLYLLFIREQPVLASGDRRRKWQDDPEAVGNERDNLAIQAALLRKGALSL